MRRERYPERKFVTSGSGRPGHRPAGLLPVCQVLAALAPGRVLPFAPGNSRKRGPGRVGGSNLRRMTAVERRKARAPPLRPRGFRGRAAMVLAASEAGFRPSAAGMRFPVDAPNGAPLPSYKGAVRKGFHNVAWTNSDAKARRENGKACALASPLPGGERSASKASRVRGIILRGRSPLTRLARSTRKSTSPHRGEVKGACVAV